MSKLSDFIDRMLDNIEADAKLGVLKYFELADELAAFEEGAWTAPFYDEEYGWVYALPTFGPEEDEEDPFDETD